MYASNKYDRELLRVPQNYAGNAFAPPKQMTSEEHAAPSRERDGALPQVQPLVRPPFSEEAAVGEDTSVHEKAANEATAAATEADARNEMAAEEKHAFSGEGVTPWGIGREELLLLGLLALTRGERQEREERGGESRDEIGLLLMLLLLLG